MNASDISDMAYAAAAAARAVADTVPDSRSDWKAINHHGHLCEAARMLADQVAEAVNALADELDRAARAAGQEGEQ